MNLQLRKRILLAILEKMGGSLSAIQMQKYLFLYVKLGGEKIYDFVPYRYGCFSFQANKDIVALASDGYVNVEGQGRDVRYRLSVFGGMAGTLDIFDQEVISSLHREFGHMTQDELISYTYRKWPFTAINSVIKEELLDEESLEKVRLLKARYERQDSVLFTIGYEGFTLEAFLRQLISNDVRVLCDVRKNAISRKYGFSKSTLLKACLGVGIDYVHVPELGIDSHLRQSLSCQDDYDMLFDHYEKTTLLNGGNHLDHVRGLLSSEKRVCLMCFEKDPRQCHRTRIAGALMSRPDVEYKFTQILL